VRRTCAAQQQFDAFRDEYNRERPHRALGGATPASRYRPSPRPYPDPLLFRSNALRHYAVGLEEVADGIWSVYFCRVRLARIDERTGTLNRG